MPVPAIDPAKRSGAYKKIAAVDGIAEQGMVPDPGVMHTLLELNPPVPLQNWIRESDRASRALRGTYRSSHRPKSQVAYPPVQVSTALIKQRKPELRTVRIPSRSKPWHGGPFLPVSQPNDGWRPNECSLFGVEAAGL